MSRAQRLTLVFALNLALVISLVTIGLAAHSLAVLAEGGDYLLDAAGVAVALLALRLSAPRPGNRGKKRHPNATNVAALVNSGWLFILELLVAAAAIDRLVAGTSRVDGLAVLVVSGIAAVVMAAGALILRADDEDKDEKQDLSVAAVLLDTTADAAAAAGVAAAGGVILATRGWYWLDPAVALAVAVVVTYHALALTRIIISRLRAPGAGNCQ